MVLSAYLPEVASTSIESRDTGGDGFSDTEEYELSGHPTNPEKIPEGTSADQDEDGVSDVNDNCIEIPNPDQLDANANGLGDTCDAVNSYLRRYSSQRNGRPAGPFFVFANNSFHVFRIRQSALFLRHIFSCPDQKADFKNERNRKSRM
ncbi:MAG: thrombospondin type 3 repeat-containing protein [Planctomycetota bacterium]